MNITNTALVVALGLACVKVAAKPTWVTMDAHSSHHYQLQQAIRGATLEQVILADGNTQALQLPATEHTHLSAFMHQQYHRCGGFVAHDSLAAAQAYTAQLNAVDPNATLVNYSIDNAETVNRLMAAVNSANLDATVSALTQFYNRYYSSNTGVDAAAWLKQHWSDITATRSDISVSYFDHSWAQPSVIATIEGSALSDEIVVIGGHLDSINQSSPTGLAPGADDNASGIAVLTQALQAMVDEGYQPLRTIQIMGFAAEEVGLRGSKAIAERYRAEGKNVVGMAQFDMTGRHGSSADIVMMTDYTNAAQNQFIAELISTYQPSISYDFDQCGYGCSDHASWYQQGFAASMPFESKMADINRAIHTRQDTAFDAEHAEKFAKLALSFVAELAKNAGDDLPQPRNPLENGVPLEGISGSEKSQQFFTLAVPENATNLRFTTSGGTGDADLYVRYGSKPSLTLFDCKSTTSNSDERCDITPTTAGTYHVMVEAWSPITGVTLLAQYDEGSSLPPISRQLNDIAVAQGQWFYETQSLAAGYQQLSVSLAGGTGDADLYLNLAAPPSESQWQCRPYKNGNDEVCTISEPQAGDWHIGIKGYQSASGVTLTINAN